MLKGIYGTCSWKQPIAFSFCKGTTPWEDIVRAFKDIVTQAQNVSLIIIASVCQYQGSTNGKAIQNLLLDSKQHAFINNETLTDNIIIINNQQIILLYDPPHLLKCICNNLLTKDLKYKLKDGKMRIAKWQHVEDAYFIDSSNDHLRIMRKLTNFHVVPNKIKTMKASYCTQVFSQPWPQ